MSSSSDVSSCEEDASETVGRSHILKPYMFEPKFSDLEIESSGDDSPAISESDRELGVSDAPPAETRTGNTDWCNCGHCVQMNNDQESICCKEGGPKMVGKIQELVCITEHPSFEAVNLNSDNLQTVHLRMHDIRADPYQDPLENDTYRWVAYTQFVYWIFKKLGPRRRKVIPSCVKNLIRERYPAPDGIYTGHRDVF